MFYTSQWGFPPGLSAAVETYEAAFRWGPAGLGLITGGTIDSACVDSGNTPTYEIRPGLLLGQKTATGTWVNYSPTATDGSEVAAGVNITAIRMQDILTGAGQSRFYGILVGGPVQAAKIINLDLMARQQMTDHFSFDDALGYPGTHWFPWKRFQTKTASYTVVAGDNFTLFDNTGATGSVTYTLPAIANGYAFAFRGAADQTWAVSSAEGSNIIALNNLTASTLTYSTGSQKIGAMLTVFSNPAGTKWVAQNVGAGVAAVTVS